MLHLKNIKKSYKLGTLNVQALKGINLSFRHQEFVSILGPSGCGKTTLLNLIGGLDQMDSGDLIIDGVSTEKYKDSDWDRYRNDAVGFVFQSYNLISHLSVLDNVTMALTLTGVDKKSRTEKAKKVLKEVGLADQVNKKPNQLSNGQMQRVAIARALVNDPKILLADEPTGALDTETSTSIMDLIQSLSSERLVIMVTHNPEIAQTYSSRIIKLRDGEVISDSSPYQSELTSTTRKFRNVSMSFNTALSSSFKNLLTKKGRTLITSFAGSIGIVGIALVLALSSGMESYITRIESDTLAGFPLQLNENVSSNNISDRPAQVLQPTEISTPEQGTVVDNSSETITYTNLLNDDALRMIDSIDPSLINSITYQRGLQLNVATIVNDNPVFTDTSINTGDSPLASNQSLFYEIPTDQTFVLSLYDLVAGTYPTQPNEAIFVIDADSTVDQNIVNALHLNISNPFEFTQLLDHKFTFVAHDVLYQVDDTGVLTNTLTNDLLVDTRNQSIEIVGVLRLKEDASSSFLQVGVGTLSAFNQAYFEQAQNSQIAQYQLNETEINVLTNQPFNSFNTYDKALTTLGADLTPNLILIYPKDFESKTLIKEAFSTYNESVSEDSQLIVSDVAESFSTTISSLISTITLILSAFAGISLVVSSIMIGIITYVSVIERTKEIGIMRSLGARKKDIARIFNAEALIIGLIAGVIGIGLSYALLIGVDVFIESFLGIASFTSLSFINAGLLITLSSILTLFAGLFPSQLAAKQDPVVALRTE